MADYTASTGDGSDNTESMVWECRECHNETKKHKPGVRSGSIAFLLCKHCNEQTMHEFLEQETDTGGPLQ